MSDPVRVLCVCTHNRTRSVMMAGFLGQRFADLGWHGVVASAGFQSSGEPPTDQTVRLLGEHRIDVSAHRSLTIDATFADSFDLVLTAEAAHVVQLAGMRQQLFARTFTLPEFVHRSGNAGRRGGLPFNDWLDRVGADRPTGIEYLDAVDLGVVGEVADPTGRAPREWATAIQTIEQLTAAVAADVA